MLKKFSRNTNSKKFIPEIDGIRFFAIFLIICYHLNTAYRRELNITFDDWQLLSGNNNYLDIGWWIIRLNMGVSVFFVLSGFILAIPFLKSSLLKNRKIILKDYYLRRLTRLEPPFIISLLFFYLVQIILLGESFLKLLPNFLSGLFYSHGIIFGKYNPINPVTWSLEVEAQFYILLPLLIIPFLKLRSVFFKALVLIFLIVFSLYSKLIIYDYHFLTFKFSILSYLLNFVVGILFAYAYLCFEKLMKSKSFIFDLLGLVFIFFMFYFFMPSEKIISNLMFNVFCVGFFFCVFRGKLFNWFFTRRIIYTIGGMCYSIYLLHFALFFLLLKYSLIITSQFSYYGGLMIQFLIVIPVMLFISCIFYLLVEKPFMNKNLMINFLKKWKK